MREGFGLLPKEFTFAAYEYIFRAPRQIIGSYVVTILMTVFGTAIGLFVIAMTGLRPAAARLPVQELDLVLHLLHHPLLGGPGAHLPLGGA